MDKKHDSNMMRPILFQGEPSFCDEVKASNEETFRRHLRQPIVTSDVESATQSPLTRDIIQPLCRMASEACNISKASSKAISSFTPSDDTRSQDSNCLKDLETDQKGSWDVAGTSRHIQMVEFNEPVIAFDWKDATSRIHSKTKFEYGRSLQPDKTILGLMMILALTAWGANLSVICGVLPTYSGVTHKILLQATEVANCGVLTGPIAVRRTKTCGTLHSISSMSCLTEDDSHILDTSGSMSHTSSYITSNPGVDNEGDTPCNSREVVQGEEQLYYPTEAATTRHHVSTPVADIIAASDDRMIDHCNTNRRMLNSTTLHRLLHQVRKERVIQPRMTHRGERMHAHLKACLSVYLTAVSENIFGSFDRRN